MSELKPCPFCGGEATCHNGDVWCSVCYTNTACGISQDEAVKNWNTRTPQGNLANAIDVLVGAMIDSNAENYNQHIVSGDNDVDYVVIVQVKQGLTPCEKLAEAEKRIASQLKLLSVAGKRIEQLESDMSSMVVLVDKHAGKRHVLESEDINRFRTSADYQLMTVKGSV